MKKLKEICKKLFGCLAFSAIASAAITALAGFIIGETDADPRSTYAWSWYVFAVFGTFFFSLGAFFGDEHDWNVTVGWPEWALRIRDIAGDITGGILLCAGFCLIIGLVIMNLHPSNTAGLIIFSIVWVFFMYISWRSGKSEEAKKLNDEPRKLIDKIAVVLGMNLVLFLIIISVTDTAPDNSKKSINHTVSSELKKSQGMSFDNKTPVEDQPIFESLSKEQKYILMFSQALQNALGLSEVTDSFEKPIGKYVIYGVRRPQYNWQPILEIRPNGLPKNHGYNMVIQTSDGRVKEIKQTVFPPEHWYYKFGGTATEIRPPAEVINQIISQINKEKGNKKIKD